ncbi:unnamed protein product [Danaus chrysippus]|uniref:(African queen) hypothetical protein n=1 Tax=Danaus chrysippus TaxID=151541 RepID=A0A8J2QG14_9NEOP|nr:unnamed protein product [Danaus chrysippus]
MKKRYKGKQSDDLCLRSLERLYAQWMSSLTGRDNRFHGKCHGGHCSTPSPPPAEPLSPLASPRIGIYTPPLPGDAQSNNVRRSLGFVSVRLDRYSWRDSSKRLEHLEPPRATSA